MQQFDPGKVPKTQTRRSKLCKLCQIFAVEKLDEINIDFVLRRKTIAQLIAECNQFLPEGVPEFYYDNFSNHRKHVNERYIVSEYAKTDLGIEAPAPDPLEEGILQLSNLLEQIRAARTVDKENTLDFLYEDRLRNLSWLQDRLAICRDAYQKFPGASLATQIHGLIQQISDLEASLTRDILAHLRVEETARVALGTQVLVSQTEDFLRLIAVKLMSSIEDKNLIRMILKEISTGLAMINKSNAPTDTNETPKEIGP
mgnify:CR=1 FL=1